MLSLFYNFFMNFLIKIYWILYFDILDQKSKYFTFWNKLYIIRGLLYYFLWTKTKSNGMTMFPLPSHQKSLILGTEGMKKDQKTRQPVMQIKPHQLKMETIIKTVLRSPKQSRFQ